MAERVIIKAPQPMSTLSSKESEDVRTEFVERVATDNGKQAEDAPQRGLARRGHAWRQPRILDDVVDRVTDVTAPGRMQRAVATLREKCRLDRVTRPVADLSAPRPNVACLLAPQGTEAGGERVGDRDTRFAVPIALAESAPRSLPFGRRVDPRLVARAQHADDEDAPQADVAVDDPLDALRRCDGDVSVGGLRPCGTGRHDDQQKQQRGSSHEWIIGHLVTSVLVVISVALASATLRAQTHGVVVDQTGLPLPGTHIEVLRGERVIASLDTGQDGGFDLPATEPMDVIVVSLDGFETARVAPEAARRVVLAIAHATETTEVVASALTSSGASMEHLGSTMSAPLAQRLPTGRPRILQSLPLLPAVLRGRDGLLP